MSFSRRLFLLMGGTLAVTVGFLVFAADRWLRRDLEAAFAEEIEREARLVAASLSREPAGLNAAAHRLGALLDRRVTFIALDGRVLGDSDFDDASLALLENHRGRVEVEAALAGRTGLEHRLSASTNRWELKVAIPAWPGVVRVSAPLEQVEAVVDGAQRAVLLGGVVALMLGLPISALAGRAIGRPLRDLAGAVRGLADGAVPSYPHSSIQELQQLVGAFRAMQAEITRRMAELGEGRQQTGVLLDAMVEGVVATDAAGNVVFCNSALRRVLSFAPGQPLPNLRELFHQRGARSVVDDALRGQPVLGREITLDRQTVLITARPLPTGGAVLCLHDVTELRRLEAVRRDFVANVSHELRTPLTNITGYAETLLTSVVDEATRQRFTGTVLVNAQRMQLLIDNLLDLAKLEAGRYELHPEPVNLKAAIEAAWSAFGTRAAGAGVEFALQVNGDQQVAADPEALRQVLSNLLDNAIRHTPAGGRIEVKARWVDGATEVVVRDTGSGIPAEHLPRVFERFYRADPHRSRDKGGSGLGLAIVKHLVEAHGGNVSIASAPQSGTTVRVTFPTAQQ